jgi:hypothetical protein
MPTCKGTDKGTELLNGPRVHDIMSNEGRVKFGIMVIEEERERKEEREGREVVREERVPGVEGGIGIDVDMLGCWGVGDWKGGGEGRRREGRRREGRRTEGDYRGKRRRGKKTTLSPF